jgi:hypothetical protein
MNDQQARVMAEAAASRLRRSERGQQALADFKNLLDHGGNELDCENWSALLVLCQLAARGRTFAIDEQFQRRATQT